MNKSLHCIAAAAMCLAAGAAQAQISRGFIAPHEYALPTQFKPFNVFVEYTTLQNGGRAWDAGGDRHNTDKVEQIVSLSKFVRAWTPESNPDLGLIFQVVVPKVGVRNKTAGSSTGGLADPIAGLAAWYKPAPQWTLGGDVLLQVPIGDADVGGGDRWNVITSGFWDAQYGALNYTGNLGLVLPGSPTSGSKPGKVWFTNHRLGWRVNSLVEPYVGLDHERQDGTAASASNDESALALGLMFHLQPNLSVATHYERGFSGQSRAVSDNVNLRVVYSW